MSFVWQWLACQRYERQECQDLDIMRKNGQLPQRWIHSSCQSCLAQCDCPLIGIINVHVVIGHAPWMDIHGGNL
jgi:hypothetical protein